MHWPRIHGLCSVSWCLAEGQWNGDQRRPMCHTAQEGLYSFLLSTRLSWYQKKHSPTHTYHGHKSSLICFMHLIRSMASSLFNLHAWQSFSATPLASVLHSKLEDAQRVHISAKWIFYSFYIGLFLHLSTESLSRAVFEITGLKDIGITTLTFDGHVMSSMTSSFDPP